MFVVYVISGRKKKGGVSERERGERRAGREGETLFPGYGR